MSIRFMRINKYEPAADEKRLAEYAEKGEFITKHGLGLAYFRKGEPKKVRYCIEASMFRPGKKLRRIYEESGWRCTARGGDFNVYMSEDENAVPIHTDQSEYAHVIQKFNRTAMWLVIYGYIIILLCILCPFILFDFVGMGIIGSMAAGYMDIGLPDSAIVGNLILLFLMLPMVGFFLHDYTEAGKFIAGSIENGKSANRAVVFNNAAKIIFADFMFDVNEIDFVLLTHAHIDHSGRIPKLYKSGYRNPIYAQKATCDLCSIMLPDSGHIQEMEIEWINRKRARAGKHLIPPMYTAEIAIKSLDLFEPMPYDEVIQINDDIKVELLNNSKNNFFYTLIFEMYSSLLVFFNLKKRSPAGAILISSSNEE